MTPLYQRIFPSKRILNSNPQKLSTKLQGHEDGIRGEKIFFPGFLDKFKTFVIMWSSFVP